MEFGVAMNAEGQIMAFLNECFGVKSQLAMELDLVVGMWKNLSSLHVDYNKIGNCTVIKNQLSHLENQPFSNLFFFCVCVWGGGVAPNFFQKVLHSMNSRFFKPLLDK